MADTLTVDVVDAKGKKAGTADLPAEVFDVQTNIPLIHQVVVAQLAAARQGTHATKTRGEVSGGGKKPYKQKGTGRARQGSTRAPQFAGGGVVHGPQPRDYSPAHPQEDEGRRTARRPVRPGSRRPRPRRLVLRGGDAPSTKDAMAALAFSPAAARPGRPDRPTRSPGSRCATLERCTSSPLTSSTRTTCSSPTTSSSRAAPSRRSSRARPKGASVKAVATESEASAAAEEN